MDNHYRPELAAKSEVGMVVERVFNELQDLPIEMHVQVFQNIRKFTSERVSKEVESAAAKSKELQSFFEQYLK